MAFLKGNRRRAKADVNDDPVKWSVYFNNHEYKKVNDCIFHYYTAGSIGPVLVLIHGGGYSALTWSLFSSEIVKKIQCRILAVDLRGHGSTEADDGDMSLEQLADDVENLIKAVYVDTSPTLVFIGHSLGGAIAVELAARMSDTVGLCVIDIVEGSALEALSNMRSVLRQRPKGFHNINEAIRWSVSSCLTNNNESARVSMPGQIRNSETGRIGSDEVQHDLYAPQKSSQLHRLSIPEECEESASVSDGKYAYVWRADLLKSEKYWENWFTGLSQKFLDIACPKILLLANISGMDTPLTIAQMQGKFQVCLLPRSGHAIHEDQPQQVAESIAFHLIRYKLVDGVLEL